MSDTTAVLVMSCDAREFLWEGWLNYFTQHWNSDIPAKVYFASETVAPDFKSGNIKIILTGKDDWSACLRTAINCLPAHIDTVFLLLEDFWLVRPMTKRKFEQMHDRFTESDMLALHCCPRTHLYRIENGFFHQKSKYLMNYQPGFWKKTFLLSCLQDGENPWQSEINSTTRLHKLNLRNKIGLEDLSWYAHVCKRGKITPEGEEMLTAISSQN